MSPKIYFLLAKYTFILTSLICGYLRWAHMCKPHDEYEEYFYPARKFLIIMFSSMIFEFPYLININSADALLYVQMSGVLTTPPISISLFRRYFFFHDFSLKKKLILYLPGFITLSILFIASLDGKETLGDYKILIWSVAGTICFIQIIFLIKITQQLLLKIRHNAEMLYSDESDFPVYFAKRWVFIPCVICLGMLLVALIGSQQAMMCRDIIMSLTIIFFSASILHPHREVFPCSDVEESAVELTQNAKCLQQKECAHREFETNILDEENKRKEFRLAQEQREQLEQKIIELIVSDQLYKKNKLKLEDLLPHLKTNSSYISEAISSGTYGSFYKMINHFRIEYCIKMMEENPEIKLQDLAFEAGFSSRTTFWRAFKAVTGKNPSKWPNLN